MRKVLGKITFKLRLELERASQGKEKSDIVNGTEVQMALVKHRESQCIWGRPRRRTWIDRVWWFLKGFPLKTRRRH
jgi:hypothetical protein